MDGFNPKCEWCGVAIEKPKNWDQARFERHHFKHCSKLHYSLSIRADKRGYLNSALIQKELVISDFRKAMMNKYWPNLNGNTIHAWAYEGIKPLGLKLRSDWMAMKVGACFFDMSLGDIYLAPDHDFDYRYVLAVEGYTCWEMEENDRVSATSICLKSLGMEKKDWMLYVAQMGKFVNNEKLEDLDKEQACAKRLFIRMVEDYKKYYKLFHQPMLGESHLLKMAEMMWSKKMAITAGIAVKLRDFLDLMGLKVDYRMLLPKLNSNHYLGEMKSRIKYYGRKNN